MTRPCRSLGIVGVAVATVLATSVDAQATPTQKSGYCGFYKNDTAPADAHFADPIRYMDLGSGAMATAHSLSAPTDSTGSSQPVVVDLAQPTDTLSQISLTSINQDMPDIVAASPTLLQIWKVSPGALTPVALPHYDVVGGPQDFANTGKEGILLGVMHNGAFELNTYDYDPATGFNHAPSATIPTGVSEPTAIAYDSSGFLLGVTSSQLWRVERTASGAWSAPVVTPLATSFTPHDIGVVPTNGSGSMEVIAYNAALTQIAVLPDADPTKPWVVSTLPSGTISLAPSFAGAYVGPGQMSFDVLAADGTHILRETPSNHHFADQATLSPASGWAVTASTDSVSFLGPISSPTSFLGDVVQAERRAGSTEDVLHTFHAGYIPGKATNLMVKPGKRKGELAVSWTPPAQPCTSGLSSTVTIRDPKGKIVAKMTKDDITSIVAPRLKSGVSYTATVTATSPWGAGLATRRVVGKAR